ncbi:MAG: carbamoyl-phosphate synthase large subunit [Chloroflexi bacterium]|nr:carbamoyl-phosphate synthase large subunit [Chloroflexota bacterium]
MTTKPSKVLIIGSGPIVIGQAAEFDYSGSQACRSLREEGVHTVLVNSNPATIMTDEGIADTIYIEPLTVEIIERIIAREQPDGLLPTLGGQTGLNLAVALADAGVLEKYNVRVLGTPIETIRRAEDRDLFSAMLDKIGEPSPESQIVTDLDQVRDVAKKIGLPLVIRPAYTLGGTGGGIAHTRDELEHIVRSGLAASPIRQVLLEQSLLGWKEIEYEVMRDGADNCVTICNMENIDPMGVHTGDSIVVAPSQTLSDNEYQMLRTASLKIIRELGIEGGCNVQFALAPRKEIVDWAVDPEGRPPYFVIEVNPRVSRSSALASKATGYPIARVAAKIATGKTLDEIPNRVTGKTTAAFEPALDYIVIKIPRWPFDKFPLGERRTGTQMKATGEVMAIDRTFEAALGKAIRSLEIGGRSVLWEDAAWRDVDPRDYVSIPTDDRLWTVMASLRRGATTEELSKLSGIDPWFIDKMNGMVAMEQRLLSETLTPDLMRQAKRKGLSDAVIGTLADRLPEQVRELRREWGVTPVYKMVDTCAAEFDAETPYFYSTYPASANAAGQQENEAPALGGESALVIGSGPIRIGQGIEFDYSAVHAAWALQEAGVAAIMANSNPETVSTDFDTSDRLYFEPLDEEGIRDLLDNESQNGSAPKSIVQFGGQTAVNLALPIEHAAHSILGSSADSIDLAEDRGRFENLLQHLGIPQPPGGAVSTVEEALQTAEAIGYPVLVRPSYVLGGRAMEIVQNATDLIQYVTAAAEIAAGKPVLIDKYLEGIEAEVDAICDGKESLIPGIMHHIERAGVHSGDSMAVYPPIGLTDAEIATISDYTQRLGPALGAIGLINVQYVIMRPESRSEGSESAVYVLEVNPRASRTVPFLSKVTGVPMVRLAVQMMLGKSLRDLGYEPGLWPEQDLVAVKAPVFSMSKLTGVDTYLGPEMKSTGEVMGVDHTFEAALAKAIQAADMGFPREGSVLLSLADQTKPEATTLIRDLAEAGYRIYATAGTAAMVRALDIPVERVPKRIEQGHPNVVDIIQDGLVDVVINTPEGRVTETLRDGFDIRRAAAEKRIPCFTSIDTASAAVDALVRGELDLTIQPLSEYLTPQA